MSEQDIIFGIRHCVQEAEKLAQKQDTLQDSDFNESGQEHNLTRLQDDKKNSFVFKDYAPLVFHQVRKTLGATPESFLASWEMDPTIKLEMSTARSGSMFYRTKDKKYLFKTILHPEVGVMMGLLRDYYEHIQKEKKTFVVKIYGLFRIKEGISTKMWILIMGNSFPPGLKMSEEYDLKGRPPKKGKSIEERPNGVTVRGPKKDNEIKRHLIFYEEEKKFFINQLQVDVQLLKKNNIMDYSLLVGIYRLSKEELEFELRSKSSPIIEKSAPKKKKE